MNEWELSAKIVWGPWFFAVAIRSRPEQQYTYGPRRAYLYLASKHVYLQSAVPVWFLPILLCCAESKDTMGERKEKHIQVQIGALHFDFFEGMRVLGNACIHLCYA